MNRTGASFLKIVVILALVLGIGVSLLAWQLWLVIPFAIFAAIVVAAGLFSRAKTPSG